MTRPETVLRSVPGETVVLLRHGNYNFKLTHPLRKSARRKIDKNFTFSVRSFGDGNRAI